MFLNELIIKRGNSLVVQWLGLGDFTAGTQVQSLAGELKSYKLCDVSKKKKIIKNLRIFNIHMSIIHP